MGNAQSCENVVFIKTGKFSDIIITKMTGSRPGLKAHYLEAMSKNLIPKEDEKMINLMSELNIRAIEVIRPNNISKEILDEIIDSPYGGLIQYVDTSRKAQIVLEVEYYVVIYPEEDSRRVQLIDDSYYDRLMNNDKDEDGEISNIFHTYTKFRGDKCIN